MAQKQLTFWFDLASSYSYLAAMRIEAEAAARGVHVTWQPFLLGPIFRAQGWETSPFRVYPAKGRYMWRDMDREAARYALPPVTRPDPFPQHSVLAARVALAGLAEDCSGGWGEAFCKRAFQAQFAEGADIAEPETLRTILTGLGADADAALARAQTPPVKDALRTATARAAELEIFGAPTFATADGELFWGNDRLEQALDWAAAGPPG